MSSSILAICSTGCMCVNSSNLLDSPVHLVEGREVVYIEQNHVGKSNLLIGFYSENTVKQPIEMAGFPNRSVCRITRSLYSQSTVAVLNLCLKCSFLLKGTRCFSKLFKCRLRVKQVLNKCDSEHWEILKTHGRSLTTAWQDNQREWELSQTFLPGIQAHR